MPQRKDFAIIMGTPLMGLKPGERLDDSQTRHRVHGANGAKVAKGRRQSNKPPEGFVPPEVPLARNAQERRRFRRAMERQAAAVANGTGARTDTLPTVAEVVIKTTIDTEGERTVLARTGRGATFTKSYSDLGDPGAERRKAMAAYAKAAKE